MTVLAAQRAAAAKSRKSRSQCTFARWRGTLEIRVTGPPPDSTIIVQLSAPRGRRVLSDIEEKQPSVWQQLSLKQLRWTVVAVIVVITAAFGGLKTAHYVTNISFGQTYTAGAVRITPHAVSVTDTWTGLPDQSIDTWADFDAPPRPRPCRYLVLAVTIQSTARESVDFPFPGVIAGMPSDCASDAHKDLGMFGITGIAGRYVATYRRHETLAVPSIEPGFTNDYSVLWAVSRAELNRHPQISIRFYKMSQYISTFLIATRWAGDANHYGELRIPNQDLS